MRYSSLQIVFQEIPNEISLAFHITGCPLRCRGCHSSDLWNSKIGAELSLSVLSNQIEKYKNYISCVLYLGGEWDKGNLISQLDHVKSRHFKTALYTGLEYSSVDAEIVKRLDYIKYGEYKSDLGGLNSPRTNQRLINLNTNENLNRYFINGGKNDSFRQQAN